MYKYIQTIPKLIGLSNCLTSFTYVSARGVIWNLVC